jgi:L-serine dehydratase
MVTVSGRIRAEDGTLLPLWRTGSADEEAVCRALYVAAGFGQVVASRATLAGAEGGCQAEVGAASAMAAAALVDLKGGTAEQCAEAFAMALTNLEGLVCDPVAGLVEIPCVKRNVIGAMNAVSAADMALAGVVGHIPADEVIDAMAEVGNAMSKDLRETGIGGLAGTPTGCKFHPRCPYCTDKCRSEVPELKEIAPGHLCACHYPL